MKTLIGAAAAAVLIVACHGALAAEPVGNASALIPSASQQPPQAARTDLRLRDPIIRNAELATADRGALEVTFLDGSRLTMGANSRLRVDEYVYAGPGGAGQQSLRFSRGLFRFVSGTIPKDRVKIQTPTVTIGIRGTALRVAQFDDATGAVAVEEPEDDDDEDFEVTVTSNSTGKTITLKSGEKITYDNFGAFGGITNDTIQGCQ